MRKRTLGAQENMGHVGNHKQAEKDRELIERCKGEKPGEMREGVRTSRQRDERQEAECVPQRAVRRGEDRRVQAAWR